MYNNYTDVEMYKDMRNRTTSAHALTPTRRYTAGDSWIFAPFCLILLLAMFRQSYFLTLAVAVLTPAYCAQWPYRQIYPPVNDSDDRTPLFYAVVLSFGGDYTSIGALPGVQIALDYINNEPSILSGYTLHYTLMDSQVILH